MSWQLDTPAVPTSSRAVKGTADKPLWLTVLKRLEVRISLWLEYRLWRWTRQLFDDRSRIARKLAHVGWVVGTAAVLYFLAHLLVAKVEGRL